MNIELVLTHMGGPLDGAIVRLTVAGASPEVTIGRTGDCTISLADDPEVSRVHARLYWREGSWWVEDCGSTNGTFLGEFARAGKVLSPSRLSLGQVFRTGRYRFRLEAEAANESRFEARSDLTK